MSDKPFKTIEDQIGILKFDRKLTFLNDEAAADSLRRYGYYEIVNGYKHPFLTDSANDTYRADATFEHMFALFTLDKHIRELTLEGLEEFENTFKQAVAYAIAEHISDKQIQYTAKSHYNRGKTYTDRNGNPKKKPPFNDRDKLLFKFGILSKSYNQPYAYYREEHGNIPPWILVKGLTLGETIYWYRLSKKNIRTEICARLLNIDAELIANLDKPLKISQAIGDSLNLILDYRNLTAHGGRVYNHRSKKFSLRYSPYLHREAILDATEQDFKKGYRKSSLGALLLILRVFDNPDPYNTINSWLVVRLSAHIKKYPQDRDLIIKNLEIENTELLVSMDSFINK